MRIVEPMHVSAPASQPQPTPDSGLRTQDFRAAVGTVPRVAITLGSGLGEALREWEVVARWPWSDFLTTTAGEVPGHRRELILAQCHGRRALLISGRLHYYQGVGMDDVTAYVRLLADAGVTTLVLTNAA